MKLRVLEIKKDGQIVEKTLAEQMSPLRHSLMEALYPEVEIARVQVPLEPLDSFEQAVVEQALGHLQAGGKIWRLVGASGSAKDGKFYAVDAVHEKQVASRFNFWPEAAISYFGIRDFSRQIEYKSSYTLTVHAPETCLEEEIIAAALEEVSQLTKAAREGDYAYLLERLGASESQSLEGKVPAEFTSLETQVCSAVLKADASGLMLRHPFIHGRLERLLARWTYKLCTSGGFKLPGFALADDGFLFLRQGRVISGSDWIPENTAIAPLISKRGVVVRYPIRMREDLLPVAFLSTGVLAALLSRNLAASGLKLEPAELSRLVDLVEDQLKLEGTLTLNSRTASRNGGDFDFDYVCAIESCRFNRWVESRFSDRDRPPREKKKLPKKKSPWWNLPQVAMSARGNQIGSITDLITSCLAAGREDLAYQLGEELQAALDGLKHGTVPDPKVIAEVRRQVKRAPWLDLKRVRRVSAMPLELEAAATDKVGHLYNRLRGEIEELFGEAAPLVHFKGLISGNPFTREMFEECQVVNKCWAAAVSAILGKEQRLKDAADLAQADYLEACENDSPQRREALFKRNQALAVLRRFDEESAEQLRDLVRMAQKWATSKMENRPGWAQVLLQIVSGGKGRGALVFHTFAQELIDAMVEKTGGRPVLLETPELPDGVVKIEQEGNLYRIYLADEDQKALLLEVTREGEVRMDGCRVRKIHPVPLAPGSAEIRDGKLIFREIRQRPAVRTNGAVH